ncbi:MAG TPA: class F sortase [Pedococcus sp.]|nr:class F sortase [Pedococcus sp.]
MARRTDAVRLAACSALAALLAGCGHAGIVGPVDGPVASSARSAAPAEPTSRAPSTSTPTTGATGRRSRSAPVVPAALPTELAIPAIGLRIGGDPSSRIGTVVSTTVDGVWSITPPEASWEDLQSAYWWSQERYSALPGAPSTGTTFVYMHACQQVRCAGNDLHRLRPGDTITLTTRAGVLQYRVAALLRLDKTPQGVGSSKTLYSYGHRNQLRLVTCGYAADGSSPFNWAVIATLQMPT